MQRFIFGSWSANPIVVNANNAPVAFSSASPGQRFFLAASYRKEYFKFGATTVATIFEGNQQNTSYLVSGDADGDGNSSNDLIYIPRDPSEMNFQPYTLGTGATLVTFSEAPWFQLRLDILNFTNALNQNWSVSPASGFDFTADESWNRRPGASHLSAAPVQQSASRDLALHDALSIERWNSGRL